MLIENDFHYPVMLNITGKHCTIIGGGTVAARKLRSLAEAGALVTVVAPEMCEEVRRLAQAYACTLIEATYAPRYLQNAFITIAATDSKEINRQVCADAPLLCNNITEPELSSFSVPASFSQGDITVALATGGMPAFTRLLKQRLQGLITPEMADFNEFLRQKRLEVLRIPSTHAQRAAFWRACLTEDVINLVATNAVAQAKEQISDAISSFRTQSQDGTR